MTTFLTATFYARLDSPVGPLLLTSDGAALTGLYMNCPPPIPPDWTQSDHAAPFPEARRQLAAYFAGLLRDFTLPLAPVGTPFQARVWDELRLIPYGETRSYGEIARRLGSPGASRAVGLANGQNCLSIVVPCHRVVGAGGRLTGYRGGLDRKGFLLALERQTKTPGLF